MPTTGRAPRRLFRVLVRLASLPLVLLTLWGVGALLWADILPMTRALRAGAAAAFALLALAAVVALLRARPAPSALLAWGAALAGILTGFAQIEPSNARDWAPEVAKLAHVTFNGDQATVHNIRNFEYRSEVDFTPRYYDRTFDIRQLSDVDLVAVYWMGPAIAHTILSFGFSDGTRLAISIETRKERTEGYSTVRGFYRNYELTYVVADERDVIGLRTTYRHPPEDVYVYRVNGKLEGARRLFRTYLERINSLAVHPEFYNTLVDNCTTGIWVNTLSNANHPPLSWKLLASGYVPEYLYEIGRLDRTLPFPALQARSHVNVRAARLGAADDFSAGIRAP